MLKTRKLHPVFATGDGIANTYTGQNISFITPDANTICLEDIIIGLSNICRWGGQIEEHFSVAQHTLLVWHLAPEELKRVALMHDAAEAYLGDVCKPLKIMLGDAYGNIERAFNEVIFAKYGLSLEDLAKLKPYDKLATEIEFNYFWLGKLDFIQKFYEINELVDGSTPRKQLSTLVKSEFLEIEYNGQRTN